MIKEDFVTKVSILITVGVKTVIMLKFMLNLMLMLWCDLFMQNMLMILCEQCVEHIVGAYVPYRTLYVPWSPIGHCRCLRALPDIVGAYVPYRTS